MNDIKNSQVAGGNMVNSTNKIIKQVRKESIIISFIVGFLASLLASYIFECFK